MSMDVAQVIAMHTAGNRLGRARILGPGDNGLVRVQVEAEGAGVVSADVLCTSDDAPPCLAADDLVLVWLPDFSGSPAVILGRIGPSHAAVAHQPEAPNQLLLEARHNLTLKCGDGSITIRADGKILIKGKDLVSHAQRTNRIKGGSVAIN